MVWGGNEISTGKVMLGPFFITVSVGESFLDYPHVLVTDQVADDSISEMGQGISATIYRYI